MSYERLIHDGGDELFPEGITELIKAKAEGRLLILPVPIGGTIYVPYKYRDLDKSIDEGIEETKLAGYIKEGDKEYYTTYDELGSNDHEPGTFYLTREEAEAALKDLEPEEYENPFADQSEADWYEKHIT